MEIIIADWENQQGIKLCDMSLGSLSLTRLDTIIITSNDTHIQITTLQGKEINPRLLFKNYTKK